MATHSAQQVVDSLGRSLVLWGAGSAVAGGLLALAGRSPSQRAFGMQNAGWGAIDVAIALVAKNRPTPIAQRLSTVLGVNAGLDVLYVLAGGHIAWHRPLFGGRVTAAQSRAHGAAIVVQGSALLILDTVHVRRLATDGRNEKSEADHSTYL